MDNGIEIYQSNNNQIEISVQFEEDTVWLSQKQMAELFGRERVAITQHIGNIFKEKELSKISVCKDFLHTAADSWYKNKIAPNRNQLPGFPRQFSNFK